MQLVADCPALYQLPFQQAVVPPPISPPSSAAETALCEMRVDRLRYAIRKNQVSFPSQVPTFPKHDRPDMQRQLVQLYFVRGWSGPKIGARYGLSRMRVQQILNSWKRRAVEVGYVQAIPPAENWRPWSERPSIQLVFSAVLNQPVPFIQRSEPSETKPPRWQDRPRRKFSTLEIAGILKQLRTGRSLEEVADEAGVSAHTVRAWKEQYELRLLRRENAQLKERLAQLGTVEKSLIDLIIRSDEASSLSFMPFSRDSNHTEFDYRQSL
jgi:transposase